MNDNYTVEFYDKDDREWVVVGGYRVDSAHAQKTFATQKAKGDRVRIQKWNGSDWVTTADTAQGF